MVFLNTRNLRALKSSIRGFIVCSKPVCYTPLNFAQLDSLEDKTWLQLSNSSGARQNGKRAIKLVTCTRFELRPGQRLSYLCFAVFLSPSRQVPDV
jgi:hypothetical protein